MLMTELPGERFVRPWATLLFCWSRFSACRRVYETIRYGASSGSWWLDRRRRCSNLCLTLRSIKSKWTETTPL